MVRAAWTLTYAAQSASRRTFHGPSGPATAKTRRGWPTRGGGRRATQYARQLADQLERRLKHGRVLVAVQNRGEDDPDQYALGHKISNFTDPHMCPHPHPPPMLVQVLWLGWATRVVKTHTESGYLPGGRLRYDRGDLEIEVEPWLTRDVSGGDERRVFRSWVATSAGEAAGQTADAGCTR